MYDDVAETGYSDRNLRLVKDTAEKIESGRRLPDLSFSHHVEVAALPPEKQEHFLNKAVEVIAWHTGSNVGVCMMTWRRKRGMINRH